MLNRNEIDNVLLQRLEKEMEQYRADTQKLSAKEIYNNYMEIGTYESLYADLTYYAAEYFDNDEKEILVRQPEGELLVGIYRELAEDYEEHMFDYDYTFADALREEGFEELERNAEPEYLTIARYPALGTPNKKSNETDALYPMFKKKNEGNSK